MPNHTDIDIERGLEIVSLLKYLPSAEVDAFVAMLKERSRRAREEAHFELQHKQSKLYSLRNLTFFADLDPFSIGKPSETDLLSSDLQNLTIRPIVYGLLPSSCCV